MSTEKKTIKKVRPTSPHLGIYKPQINSTMSIFHRFTGIGLFFGFSIMAWWLVAWVFSKFDPLVFDLVNFPIVKWGLYIWIVAFFYHLCNGIRHLFWDIGYGYSIKALFRTSYLVLLTTIGLSAWFFYTINY